MAEARSIATRTPGLPDAIEGGGFGVTTVAEMTGPQRAAVILLVLGEEHGRKIWQEFDLSLIHI